MDDRDDGGSGFTPDITLVVAENGAYFIRHDFVLPATFDPDLKWDKQMDDAYIKRILQCSREGETCFREGGSGSDNPHQVGTEEFRAWSGGFRYGAEVSAGRPEVKTLGQRPFGTAHWAGTWNGFPALSLSGYSCACLFYFDGEWKKISYESLAELHEDLGVE